MRPPQIHARPCDWLHSTRFGSFKGGPYSCTVRIHLFAVAGWLILMIGGLLGHSVSTLNVGSPVRRDRPIASTPDRSNSKVCLPLRRSALAPGTRFPRVLPDLGWTTLVKSRQVAYGIRVWRFTQHRWIFLGRFCYIPCPENSPLGKAGKTPSTPTHFQRFPG